MNRAFLWRSWQPSSVQANPDDNSALMRSWQKRQYANGQALRNHTAQHDGEVQSDCPACAEIQRRMRGAK